MQRDVQIAGRGYLVEGNADTLPAIMSILGSAGIKTVANPDLYVREYLSFGIDDARELRDRAEMRALGGGVRVFVIVTPRMTVDAQNALLKTLEEPPADAAFFFVVSSPQMLLSTLRSRTQILKVNESIQKRSEGVPVKEFLGLTPEKRIELMKPLYSHDENDERDVRQAVAFLTDLEKSLASRKSEKHVRDGIRAIYRARKYMNDKGSLLKGLLEQVALLVPRV